MVDVDGYAQTRFPGGLGAVNIPHHLLGNFAKSQRQLLRKISPMMHGKTNRRQSHGQQKTWERAAFNLQIPLSIYLLFRKSGKCVSETIEKF